MINAYDSVDSPTTIEAALEYITVENYNWPKSPPPRRPRVDEKERKRRHNECQKRFLARKRRDREQLRQDVGRLEVQLKLMEAMWEARVLQTHHEELLRELKTETMKGSDRLCAHLIEPIELQANEPDMTKNLVENVMKLLDIDALVVELGKP